MIKVVTLEGPGDNYNFSQIIFTCSISISRLSAGFCFSFANSILSYLKRDFYKLLLVISLLKFVAQRI